MKIIEFNKTDEIRKTFDDVFDHIKFEEKDLIREHYNQFSNKFHYLKIYSNIHKMRVENVISDNKLIELLHKHHLSLNVIIKELLRWEYKDRFGSKLFHIFKKYELDSHIINYTPPKKKTRRGGMNEHTDNTVFTINCCDGGGLILDGRPFENYKDRVVLFSGDVVHRVEGPNKQRRSITTFVNKRSLKKLFKYVL